MQYTPRTGKWAFAGNSPSGAKLLILKLDFIVPWPMGQKTSTLPDPSYLIAIVIATCKVSSLLRI